MSLDTDWTTCVVVVNVVVCETQKDYGLYTSPTLLSGSFNTGTRMFLTGNMEPVGRKKFEVRGNPGWHHRPYFYMLACIGFATGGDSEKTKSERFRSGWGIFYNSTVARSSTSCTVFRRGVSCALGGLSQGSLYDPFALRRGKKVCVTSRRMNASWFNGLGWGVWNLERLLYRSSKMGFVHLVQEHKHIVRYDGGVLFFLPSSLADWCVSSYQVNLFNKKRILLQSPSWRGDNVYTSKYI